MKAPTLRQRAATTGAQKSIEGLPEATPGTDCRHYWEIEIAVSQVSRGICRLCGSCRQFSNYLADCVAAEKREKYHEWFPLEECQGMLAASDPRLIADQQGGLHPRI